MMRTVFIISEALKSAGYLLCKKSGCYGIILRIEPQEERK